MKSEVNVETGVGINAPQVKGKVEKKGGRRIGYNYIILKSLKESPKNDVVKCIYIRSLTDFGICVIKEGTAGGTKDKYNRDIKDRLVWQKELHKLLQGKVRIPRLIGSFEENGNYYLAIEHIKGQTLGSLFKKYGKELRNSLIIGDKTGIRFLGYLLKIIDLLDTLHKNQIVHRDVSSANFIISKMGEVSLIDMELSYSLQKKMPEPPFQLGTQGYMSPEQLAISTPTIKEDIFSLGAILLQAWTGIGPAKLTQAPFEDLEDKVFFFIPDTKIARIVLQCLHPDAEKRPLLRDVYSIIEYYRSDLKRRTIRETHKQPICDREQIQSTIQHVIYTLASPLLADKEKGWFSENRNMELSKDKNNIHKAWYTSFNVGSTGVLYFLSKAHSVGFDIEGTRPYLRHTLSLIEDKYINNFKNVLPGLHFGADGVAACLAEAIQCGLIDYTDKYRGWINTLLSKKTKLLDIISGVAGQGVSNLICSKVGDIKEINNRLKEDIDYLLSRQEKDGAWMREIGNASQNKRITRGFAHGVAGIVHFLLDYARYYNDKTAIDGAEMGLQWLMRNAVRRKKFIEWYSFEGRKIAPWWCDGGPGIALAFMKGYALLGNPLYKEFATGALNYHPEKVLSGSLSQYNGLSGLGEIYLEAYQLLQNDEWLKRAEWIAQMILRLKKHHGKYGQYWLVENERQPVPGFMIGNSGIAHFLLRYCYNDKIGFPMIPDYNRFKMAQGFDGIGLQAGLTMHSERRIV